MKRIIKYYKQLIQDMQIAHENEVNDLKYHIEWLEKHLVKYYDVVEFKDECEQDLREAHKENEELRNKLEEYEKK